MRLALVLVAVCSISMAAAAPPVVKSDGIKLVRMAGFLIYVDDRRRQEDKVVLTLADEKSHVVYGSLIRHSRTSYSVAVQFPDGGGLWAGSSPDGQKLLLQTSAGVHLQDLNGDGTWDIRQKGRHREIFVKDSWHPLVARDGKTYALVDQQLRDITFPQGDLAYAVREASDVEREEPLRRMKVRALTPEQKEALADLQALMPNLRVGRLAGFEILVDRDDFGPGPQTSVTFLDPASKKEYARFSRKPNDGSFLVSVVLPEGKNVTVGVSPTGRKIMFFHPRTILKDMNGNGTWDYRITDLTGSSVLRMGREGKRFELHHSGSWRTTVVRGGQTFIQFDKGFQRVVFSKGMHGFSVLAADDAKADAVP